MRSITFFARPAFTGNECGAFNDTHLIRLSSEIRGRHIAEYIGGKYNPKEGFEDDLIIHVKPRNLRWVKSEHWLDICDDPHMVPQLKDRPDIRIIASSQYAYEYLKKKVPNEIIVIHQQHLNWENAQRERKEVTTGGYIGGPSALAFQIYGQIAERLEELGFSFRECYNFKTREDAAEFYKNIDFLVIGGFELENENYAFATATKMINAASFGVPSIAKRLKGYQEFEGNYIAVENIYELLEEAEKLRDLEYYKMWSEKARKAAEKYHISEVAKLYKQLV